MTKSAVTTFSLNDLFTLIQGQKREVSLSSSLLDWIGPEICFPLVGGFDESIFEENLSLLLPVFFLFKFA